MSLISYNLMAFYAIWVGFSLKIIILIGEHCYLYNNPSYSRILIGSRL